VIVGVATVRGRLAPAPPGTRELRRELARIADEDAIERHLDDLYTGRGSWAADLIGDAS
jgi:hypothetical protein